MPDKVPIKAAKDVAIEYNLRQVILIAWDGKLTHVVTYGKSVEDCDQAARGGNAIKKALGWPENRCNDKPYRVKSLRVQIAKLQAKIGDLVSTVERVSLGAATCEAKLIDEIARLKGENKKLQIKSELLESQAGELISRIDYLQGRIGNALL